MTGGNSRAVTARNKPVNDWFVIMCYLCEVTVRTQVVYKDTLLDRVLQGLFTQVTPGDMTDKINLGRIFRYAPTM